MNRNSALNPDRSVTVIVPSYNHEKYIKQCIESIMTQSYANLSLIVIDDGSTDRSPDIIKELQSTYSFKFISQKNKGLIPTLNLVLKTEDIKKYVCLVASDDYWPKDKTSIQVEFMENHPECYLSFGNYIEVDSSGNILEKIKCTPPKNYFFQEMLLSNYIPAPTVMIRTSVFTEVGYFEPNFRIEDWHMWLKILKAHPHQGYINQTLAFYRIHQGNFHKNVDLMTIESIKILDLYKNEPLYKRALSIVQSKKIVKSFLVSFKKGVSALISDFNMRLMIDLLFCLIQRRGPFRKFKIKYWNT